MSQAVHGDAAPRPVAELRVSGHLMTLDPGMFCIVHKASPAANAGTGLPGVRVSLPPGPAGRPDAVSIRGFRDDGWLGGHGDAALVRVTGAPAQVLVTIYQAPGAPPALAAGLVEDGAPALQVLRLVEADAPPLPIAGGMAAMPRNNIGDDSRMTDLVAHIQGRGDVGAMLGDWLGETGSHRWIEGFAIAPSIAADPAENAAEATVLEPDMIEYQATLGRGWLSPWVGGGQFCGSRGMALPVLGLKVRLRGDAAARFECSYSASFVDGTLAGPMQAGESCEAESLSPLEAMRLEIRPRDATPEMAPAGGQPRRRK